MIPFVEVLNRANNGPYCKPNDWDLRVIPQNVTNVIADHGLKGTYDPRNPVNTDDTLADEFFKAGYDLAIETGMYCIETQRMIKYSEDELKAVIKGTLDSITYGKPPDDYVVKARRPDDNYKSMAFFGPLGQPIDEDLFIPISQSTAQHKLVDGLCEGSLETIYGVEIIAGTPLETLAGKYEATLVKEAIKRAGRPGLPSAAVETSPTAYGHFGGLGVPGGYEKTDANFILSVSELKTSYLLLHKVAYSLNSGIPIYSGCRSMIGGYAGTPEGAAVIAIAALILQIPTHQATHPEGSSFDVWTFSNTSRPSIWADSISGQAQTRNVSRPNAGILSVIAGPCTDMLLYECTALISALSTSGRSLIWGVRAGGGKHKNHSTGLENKFAAQVMKACTGMKRGEANDLVKEILPKYEHRLRAPPKGKSFLECYDLKSLTPSVEWRFIYEKVKNELDGLGMTL